MIKLLLYMQSANIVVFTDDNAESGVRLTMSLTEWEKRGRPVEMTVKSGTRA